MFRRLLVPVAFNESTKCAVAEALELHLRFGSSVHLFHLAEEDEAARFLAGTGADSTSPQELVDAAKDRLRRFVTNILPGHETDFDIHASVGVDLAGAVETEAERVRATLVLLGDEPHPRMFRTDVEKVVQRLTCPVLLVRTPRNTATPIMTPASASRHRS